MNHQRWAPLSLGLVLLGCSSSPRLDEHTGAMSQLPEIALAIEDTRLVELEANHDGYVAQLEVDVVATLPRSEPDFSTTFPIGWVMHLRPQERVVLADGSARVSSLEERRADIWLPAHDVRAIAHLDDEDRGAHRQGRHQLRRRVGRRHARLRISEAISDQLYGVPGQGRL